jgi:hypothetical protein
MPNNWDMPGDDWIRRARRVADDDLLRQIVEDNRAPLTPRSAIPPTQAKAEAPKPYRYGWTDAAPLPRPEGIEHVDALVDAQDAVDKAERVRKLAQTEALRRAEAELKARQLGLSHEEWARLSEKDIAARKEQQLKKTGGK